LHGKTKRYATRSGAISFPLRKKGEKHWAAARKRSEKEEKGRKNNARRSWGTRSKHSRYTKERLARGVVRTRFR